MLLSSLFLPQRREAEGRRSVASTRRPIDTFAFNTSARLARLSRGCKGGRGVEGGAPAGGWLRPLPLRSADRQSSRFSCVSYQERLGLRSCSDRLSSTRLRLCAPPPTDTLKHSSRPCGWGWSLRSGVERFSVFAQPGRACERTEMRRNPPALHLSWLSPCSWRWEPPQPSSGSALSCFRRCSSSSSSVTDGVELFVERGGVAACEALLLISCQSQLLSWDFFTAQIHPNRIRVLIFLYYCFNGMQTGSRS